jgi:hypothetical protein
MIQVTIIIVTSLTSAYIGAELVIYKDPASESFKFLQL